MRKIKGILKVLTLVVLTSLFFGKASFATQDSTGKYLELYNLGNGRQTGFYTVVSKGNGNEPVIKIVEVGATGNTVKDYNNAIYCIKDGYGFGSTGTESKVFYNQYFDLKDPASIDTTYKFNLPTGDAYNEMVWVLNNICIPSDDDSRKALLNAAEIDEDAFDNYSISGKSNSDVRNDIIESIQQAAIWYYSNNGDKYQPELPTTFTVASTNGGQGTALENLNSEKDLTSSPVATLYKYLVNGAKKAVEEEGFTATSIQSTSKAVLDSSKATASLNGSNFLVGPYKITNLKSTDSFTASVKNGTSDITGAKIIKADKTTAATGSTLVDQIKSTLGSEFYVSVPQSANASSMTLSINRSYEEKKLTFWSAPANKIESTQPVAVIENKLVPNNLTDTKDLRNPIFDLALRKYIYTVTNVSGEVTTINRAPTYTQDDLKALVNRDANGTVDKAGLTAYKRSSKKAVTVSNGDRIVYTIRVYNEGEIDGTAKTITEYIPEGLTFVKDSTINTKYGWTLNGNVATTSYLNGQTVKAISGTENNYVMDYKEVQIELTVDGTATTEDVHLKNISKITEKSNSSNIKDIDNTTTSLTTDQINNYKPQDPENGLGIEDDDDYEDVVLLAKNFDLSLVKSVLNVNGNPVANAYKGPTAQELAAFAANRSVATFERNKPTTSIKAGDTVVFEITVYNEGDLDGRVTEITDYLPDGLTLVENSTINNQYGWKKDASNAQKVTTSYTSSTNLKAFNMSPVSEYTISSASVAIEVKVADTFKAGTKIKNIAEISKAVDSTGKTVTDKDSTVNNLTTYVTDINNYNPGHAGYGYEDDDDSAEVEIRNKEFDLALSKYITKVGETTITDRTPNFKDTKAATDVATGKTTDLFSKDTAKTPVKVKTGDKIVYTISAYNEGEVAGRAKEITDFLPDGLKLVENSEINSKYGWKVDGNKVSTDYLKDKVLNALTKNAQGGYDVSHEEVQIEVEVVSLGLKNANIKNYAEITKTTNEDGTQENVPDRDSTPGNWDPTKPTNPDEDDDDYDEVVVERYKTVLKKFVTQVNNDEVTNRIPEVDASKFEENGTCVYNVNKEPVKVEKDDVVYYTIRVYNEGNQVAYADTIEDSLPEGLTYLPDNAVNKKYGWKANGDVVTTNYLSKANEAKAGDNAIKAFDPATMSSPDYREVVIAFKVTKPVTEDRTITNIGTVKKITNEDGDDETPDPEDPDNHDEEKVYVKYFDLALRKYVTQAIVIEDGQEKVMNTGKKADDDSSSVVKVEVNKKRMTDTVIKFRYGIRVSNEGEIAGHALEVSDYIPKGMKFNQADNPDWKEVNGKITTDQLKDTLLQPGESSEVAVTLTWVNADANIGVIANTAEISADDNDDINSTPNNQKEGENDMDKALIAITVVAGKAQTFIALTSVVLLIVGSGVFFIKKFVI